MVMRWNKLRSSLAIRPSEAAPHSRGRGTDATARILSPGDHTAAGFEARPSHSDKEKGERAMPNKVGHPELDNDPYSQGWQVIAMVHVGAVSLRLSYNAMRQKNGFDGYRLETYAGRGGWQFCSSSNYLDDVMPTADRLFASALDQALKAANEALYWQAELLEGRMGEGA